MLNKEAIRKEIWSLMEASGISRFPKPIKGRIPNFKGSEKAAKRLLNQSEFLCARVVKVNPDSPQAAVRRGTLFSGKLLLMPSPRLKKGFILLDSKKIPKKCLKKASTIKGAFKYGIICSLENLPNVDLVVAGSVAVTTDGIRIGKGGGYSEIEYGILRELGLISEKTPIFTTVHEIQIIDEAPKEEHDFYVDAIFTPDKKVKVERKYCQPTGIIWEKLTKNQLEDIPILHELKKKFI